MDAVLAQTRIKIWKRIAAAAISTAGKSGGSVATAKERQFDIIIRGKFPPFSFEKPLNTETFLTVYGAFHSMELGDHYAFTYSLGMP